MKQAALIGLVGLALWATHSSVYACDHSAPKSAATTTVRCAPTRDLVAGPKTEVKAVAFAPVVTFEVGVPGQSSTRVVHLVGTHRRTESSHPVVRTARAAMTLGRAIKTTVEAVMGTLVNAAAEKTAALV
jgi:hypothetical protein